MITLTFLGIFDLLVSHFHLSAGKVHLSLSHLVPEIIRATFIRIIILWKYLEVFTLFFH